MKLLYNNDEIALYFDEESAIFIEYERNPKEKGTGKKSYTAPEWYLRELKINALLQSQPATGDDTKES